MVNNFYSIFSSNKENKIYEDEQGNIYISADNEGIYKISFTHQWDQISSLNKAKSNSTLVFKNFKQFL